MTTKKRLVFALAGRLVSRSNTARKILLSAMLEDKQWLIPLARSVMVQLRRAGQ